MCSNNYLIHNRLWNTCANGFGRGCPSSIREGIQKILEESRQDELFNPMRLDPEDDEKLEEICQILEALGEQVAAMEDTGARSVFPCHFTDLRRQCIDRFTDRL